MDQKELPNGIDSFLKIREEGSNYYYVDKTAFIAKLAMKEGHYFLSRPRRFGKSLLIHTLKELFKGNKELFEGLYIYDKWNWDVKYPVLWLDFGKGDFTERGQLHTAIMEQLTDLEDEEGVKPKHESAPGRLAHLIRELAKRKKQRVVILVDEYDKPITNALDTPGTEDVALANRNTLRGFYSTIKQCNEDIHFTFLTGVTKFAHAGDLSTVVGGRRRQAATGTIDCVSAARSGQPRPLVSHGLNNLTDITLDREFSSICGYTDHDLDTVFAPELEKLAREDITREEIREWYDGYSWRGKERVYNPFSILQLFIKREFYVWWFDTGTPSFLIEALKKRGGIGTLDLAGMFAGNELLSSIDIGKIKVPALLFQTGYLTIAREKKSGGKAIYQLDFPNREVRESLHQELLDAIAPEVAIAAQPTELRDALVSGDFDTVEAILHAVFAKFPKEWYLTGDASNYESNYAVTMYNTFMATGLVVRAEDSTSEGRIDLVVEAGTRICVFELKVLKPGVDSGDALQQIRDRRYADKYRARGIPIHLVGVEFDPKKRNIKHFDFEEA